MWKGEYECLECGEKFYLERENVEFPEHTYMQVVHDHKREPVAWVGMVFNHAKRQRWPVRVKEMQEVVGDQKKAVAAAKKAANAPYKR